MARKQVLRRRKLTKTNRTRLTSYYDDKEKHEIEAAAISEGVSLSSFVASASLKEARKINSQERRK
jgi:uncharacterized protein (DUF1778 family)